MSKIISFEREAKEKLKNGIDKVNKAVSVTMGPFGRNVLIEKEYGQVASTKDGVTVAKSITLEDPIENMAATVIKQAAQKTVDAAGDGTTTSTVLAHSIATQALEATAFASANATQIKRGIEAGVKHIVDELKKLSQEITDDNQIKQIAKLSANGDNEIGELVATALDKVGRDGVVTVEKSRTGETSLEIVEGMQFDRGYKSHYMVTDNNTMQAILNDAYILLYDKRISQVKDLLPILESVSSQNKSLLIIAEDIDGEALSTLIVNKMRGVLKVAAVKAPDFGERRSLILEDIATLTGGNVVSPDKGMRLDKFNTEWFGQARVVTVGKDMTTIVDGKGNEEKISQRIQEIKQQIEKPGISPYEMEKLQERLAKIIGGVAVINIGGGTEIEMDEKKDRLDDALQATKAALDEGIIPGAGVSLLHARETMEFNPEDGSDFNIGKQIISKACQTPFEQILKNAGEEMMDYYMTLAGEYSKGNKNLVPDIENGDLVDAFQAGVIDPTKVVRNAIQNAAAAAVTLLMTECVIHEKVDAKKKDDDMSGLMM
jgi:chaperonin GroEL